MSASVSLPCIGLYYPFIQFRSDEWVKLAALYWDRMDRIVPFGHSADDSDTVQVLEKEKFIDNRIPDPNLHLPRVAEKLTAVIRDNEAELVQSYGVRNILSSPPGQAPHAGHVWRGSNDPSILPGQDPRLSYLYITKMTFNLMDALITTGLGVPSRNEFIGMHPQLAYVYMQALAQEMASETAHPVTDDSFDHVAEACSAEQITVALLEARPNPGTPLDPDEIDLQFASIAIQSVIPSGIAEVPVKKIVEVRKKCRAELTAFQSHIEDLSSQLRGSAPTDDREALRGQLEVFNEKTLKSDLATLKGKLRSVGVDTVLGAFNLKVVLPTLLTSAAPLFHVSLATLNPVVVAGGAVAFTLVPHVREKHREASEIIEKSPAAYLLQIQERLEPKGLAGQVARQVRRLVPGFGL